MNLNSTVPPNHILLASSEVKGLPDLKWLHSTLFSGNVFIEQFPLGVSNLLLTLSHTGRRIILGHTLKLKH